MFTDDMVNELLFLFLSLLAVIAVAIGSIELLVWFVSKGR